MSAFPLPKGLQEDHVTCAGAACESAPPAAEFASFSNFSFQKMVVASRFVLHTGSCLVPQLECYQLLKKCLAARTPDDWRLQPPPDVHKQP